MHPTLFTVPGTDIELPSYGAAIALALLFGWFISLRNAREDKLPDEALGTPYVISAALVVIGARGLWLLQHPSPERSFGEVFMLQPGGLAATGAVMSGLLATFLIAQAKKVPFWAWADCLAPAVLLGVAIERVGAYLAGADFGHLADAGSAFAVHYPTGSPAYAHQQAELSGLPFPPGTSMPVHPSQLYLAALVVVGLVVLHLLRKRRTFSGQLALVALSVYFVGRMVVEDAFRADPSPEVMGSVTSGQIGALVLVGMCVAAWTTLAARARADAKAARQWEGGPWTPGWGKDGPKSDDKGKSSDKKSKSKKKKKKAKK